MSKGSRQRPVNKPNYDRNWDNIFGRPQKDKPKKKS